MKFAEPIPLSRSSTWIRLSTERNAAFFGKQYDEIPGGMEYFQKIVGGPYESADFCIIPPGGTIQQELWFSG